MTASTREAFWRQHWSIVKQRMPSLCSSLAWPASLATMPPPWPTFSRSAETRSFSGQLGSSWRKSTEHEARPVERWLTCLYRVLSGPHQLLAWLDRDQTLGRAAVGARLQSKALCLQARWMQEDRSAPPQEIIACFQRAIAVQPHTEKVYVLLGRFYDSLTPEQDALPAAQARQQWMYRQLALEHYARSLRYGCRYVYHSLPRLITLWLDDQVEPVADSQLERQREHTSAARSKAVATDETALVQTELTDSRYHSFATPSTHVL
ncbi:multidrug-resistance type transporter aminotriazole resistance [Cyanidiococcus yangmingshanensis]|uniref:Multidrug-resistance type transporter aminotriazole resistance n=1 Tax=Cyanidiococcus yangmingshanensis TaxID=2690220 RepID=A0A7J7II78_9RHOD|nr:multidrug-resistance type transporter aminotriazole resistance [Cyanidiococcus yangmingshanensis]